MVTESSSSYIDGSSNSCSSVEEHGLVVALNASVFFMRRRTRMGERDEVWLSRLSRLSRLRRLRRLSRLSRLNRSTRLNRSSRGRCTHK